MKKVFLGGYINIINAQNINCKALAKFLDKKNFRPYTMQLSTSDWISLDGVKTFKCYKPFGLFTSLAYLWGVLNCDLLYLPKYAVDTPRWIPSLASFLSKKMISTLEIQMYEPQHYNRYVNCFKDEAHFIKQFQSLDAFYPITHYLKRAAEGKPIKVAKEILYLGVDFDYFHAIYKPKNVISNVVFVGNLSERKNAVDIIYLSKVFPDIHFHLVGDGVQSKSLKKTAGKNATFYGKLGHEELLKILKKSDLHYLPSRSEGFPKVILETAAAGIPSMIYSDYGADEWVTHEQNGFIVKDREEAVKLIEKWKKKSLLLVSENAVKMASDFDWKVVIKKWEEEFAK